MNTETRRCSRRLRVGGVLLFGAGLFLIGDRRMLFNRTIEIYSEFANIARSGKRREGSGRPEWTPGRSTASTFPRNRPRASA